MSRELIAQFAALPIRQARTNVSDISEAPRIFVGAEDQRSDSSCRTARAGEEAAHYGLTISSQGRFDPIPRSLARLVDRGNILGDYTFQMMFAGYLEHGRPVDVEPVRWALWPSHFDSKAQRSPVGGCPSVASIGGTGFPEVALISPLCAGLYWFRPVFGQFSEVETIAI